MLQVNYRVRRLKSVTSNGVSVRAAAATSSDSIPMEFAGAVQRQSWL